MMSSISFQSSIGGSPQPLNQCVKKLRISAPFFLERGTSLIEALVSLVVLAFGILGMLGIQIKSMSDNKNATQRVIAARIADDLFERIKANRGGISNISSYVIGVNQWPATNPPPIDSDRCDKIFCSPQQQSAFDLWQWRERVSRMLDGGRATTFISPSDPGQIGVMVAWPIRLTDVAIDDSYQKNNQKTSARFQWLNVDVPGGAICPANMVCHVAYSQP
ncbi:MAG: type IV pilus modification protein PilV [Burkholderiales bacterium]